MNDRLEKQLRFALEADKEKNIVRQTLISDGSRRENDAEHAWHAALMAVLLHEHSNEKIDLLRTVTMLLIHDIVEIDAGDTYAYDEQAKLSQRDRETAAADRIFGLLPDDQRDSLRAIWEEFEAGVTAEAKFARTMDNLQPMTLNNATGGRVWKERGAAPDLEAQRDHRRGFPSPLGIRPGQDHHPPSRKGEYYGLKK